MFKYFFKPITLDKVIKSKPNPYHKSKEYKKQDYSSFKKNIIERFKVNLCV